MRQPHQPLLRFEQVEKFYGEGDGLVRALRGVDFTINNGDFTAIMGPSGSGKSTTMNILGCLDRPSLGNYIFAGQNVTNLTNHQRALLRRHYLGFVFQGYNLLARTSAVDNVELPLIYRGTAKKVRHQAALTALDQVGLVGREYHTPQQLSGGQQQRVAIARAIVANPLILLADEPTGNLDQARSHEIMTLLQTLNRNKNLTIIMVTHEPEMADYANHIITFKDGHINTEHRHKMRQE